MTTFFFFSISSCFYRFNSQISRLSCNRKEALCCSRRQQLSFEINSSFFITLPFLWPYFFPVDLLSLTGFFVWVTVRNIQILTGKAPLNFGKKAFPLAVHFLLFCWKDFKPGCASCVLVQHIYLGKQKYYRGVSRKKYVGMSCFAFRRHMYFFSFVSFISPLVSHNHGNKRFICP